MNFGYHFTHGSHNMSINSKKETIDKISRRKLFKRECSEIKRNPGLDYTSKSRTLSKNSRSRTLSGGANVGGPPNKKPSKKLKSKSQSRDRNSIRPSGYGLKHLFGTVFGTSQERHITDTAHTFNKKGLGKNKQITLSSVTIN